MQAIRSLELTGLMVLAVLATVMFVSATPPPHYDYSATSNFHGTDVPLGAWVTVYATTTAPQTVVDQVTFIWKNAAGETVYTDVVPVSGGQAQSTEQPTSLGDWGVQTFFQGPDGKTKEGVTEVVAIRATSFFEASEYAFGGLLALGACFAGFVVFKKRNSLPQLKSKP
jgi:hypothetical protein